MDPQQVKPVLKDIKLLFETTTPKKSDTCSEAERPKRVKRDNPEWLKASKVEPPNNKVDDFQNLKRSSSVSVSKKSFQIPSNSKSSNGTDIAPIKERPKKTVRDNPEWLKTSKIESQSNKTEELQRSSSVSVQSSKTSFEKATTKNQSDNFIREKPKKTVLDNPEWLKSSRVDSSANKIDQVRERASSVSVKTSKTSFEGKERSENSFKAWKQKRDSEKLAEDAHLSSLYGHLSPEKKKLEIDCMKMKRNIEAQIKVEAQYNEKVVAVLQLEKPGAETRTVKFTNVGAGIAGNFTSLSCTISELKTPEQIKAEQGLLAESICWAEQEALEPPLEAERNKSTGVKENGEVDSESMKFTDVKAGIAEQFTDNLMLKTPEQMKAERIQKLRVESGQNVAKDDSVDLTPTTEI